MTAPRVTGGTLPPLRAMGYLALGDSYTIGEGIAAGERWPVQLARALRAEGVMLADPRIVATTGWSTDELSAALDAYDADPLPAGAAEAATPRQSDPEELAASAAPTKTGLASRTWDLVSLLIGVNDQYRGRAAGSWRDGYARLLDRAVGYAGGRADRVLALSIPDWGVTPFAVREGRDPVRIARELDAYDAVARAECAQRGIAFVDITAVSRDRGAEPGMLADDELHPSAAMHAEWTRLALPVARRLLAR